MESETEKSKSISEKIYNPMSRFDSSNQIHHTAVIFDNVRMGKNNIIGPYSVIGSNGEIRNCNAFNGEVIIGDGNIISELVTIQRPAEKNKITKIGNNNLIMAHSHIGHDVEIGNNCEVCTGSIIGGFVIIEDNVKIKLGVTIRNRKKIKSGALIGLGSAVVKDVEENSIVYGNPARKAE